MRVLERTCEVCGQPADLDQTSAIHARVVWLCTRDGVRFNGPAVTAALRDAPSTLELHRRIDCWLEIRRSMSAAAGE